MSTSPVTETRRRIVDAAEALHEELGGRLDAVTLDLVQDRVGRGSRSTVSAVVREWKLQKQLPARLLREDAPPAANDAARVMWESAKRIAAVEFDESRQVMQTKVDEANARATEADALARAQQRIAAELQAELTRMAVARDTERLASAAESARVDERQAGLREQIRFFRQQAQDSETRVQSAVDGADRHNKAADDRLAVAEARREAAEILVEAQRKAATELRVQLATENAHRIAAESRAKNAGILATERAMGIGRMADRLKEALVDLEERDVTNRELHQALATTERRLSESQGRIAALAERLDNAEALLRSGPSRTSRWRRARVLGQARP